MIPIGDAVNLVGTVPGDVLLSRTPEAECETLVSAVLSGRARTTQLARMRFAVEKGYSAYSVESLGLTGIAVPVSGAGRVLAALAISGPEPRFSVDIAESWLPELSAAAKRLEPLMETD